MAKWFAVVALTVMGPLTPDRVAVETSVADSTCEPAVSRVTLKVPTPSVSALLAVTKWALPSLLVNVTVPV